MKAEPRGCREWRGELGALALDRLGGAERAALEAHLEGCDACREEAGQLAAVARLLPLADPGRVERSAPRPAAELGDRIAARIGAERRAGQRRRRGRRLGFGLAGATALAAVALLVAALAGGGGGEAGQRVEFGALPGGVHIAATLAARPYGTEVQMYVSGIRPGTLCRVYLRGAHGERVSAGTFRYRRGDDAEAVLSSALGLGRTRAVAVRAGKRIFTAPVGAGPAAPDNQRQEETT